jgi:hypothetical protein
MHALETVSDCSGVEIAVEKLKKYKSPGIIDKIPSRTPGRR